MSQSVELALKNIKSGFRWKKDEPSLFSDEAVAADDNEIFIPSIPMESLGDAAFRKDHGLKYAYVGGAMANGIASVELVAAMADAGMLGFFGAAGLPVARVAEAVDKLQARLGNKTFGVNFIHNPNEPEVEDGLADLFIEKGLRFVEASAFLQLTLPIVRYRLHGIYRDANGTVIAPNKVMAKVSRIELGRLFYSPAPQDMVDQLVTNGCLTAEQGEMAKEIPVATDLTAEADSGGHTDFRPALALIPTILSLREQMQKEYNYSIPLRVGAAGGISTPTSAAAAFAMGVSYIVTGTVNQACIESGSSPLVREMLAKASPSDVAACPCADMFEIGAKVQVLKNGTMFPMRANKLAEFYKTYNSLEELPANVRSQLEKQFFRKTLEQTWEDTRAFFLERDPVQVERAEKNPKHKMALVFRSYLGQSSHWANRGEEDRKFDFQIWCGPAMGAFNEWVKGTFLEAPEARDIATVSLNILYGTAVLTRYQFLKMQGYDTSSIVLDTTPLTQAELTNITDNSTTGEFDTNLVSANTIETGMGDRA